MAVQIGELEVVPEPQEREPELEQHRGQTAGGVRSPELEQEIARTVALMRSRELRLSAR